MRRCCILPTVSLSGIKTYWDRLLCMPHGINTLSVRSVSLRRVRIDRTALSTSGEPTDSGFRVRIVSGAEVLTVGRKTPLTGSRATLLVRFAVVLIIFLCAQAQATAAHYYEDMICGAELSRPDRNPALHEQTISRQGGTIAYYRFGHGSPVVLITGYRASISEWNTYFLGALARNHEVVVFENRGIGRSTSGTEEYRIKDMADDAAWLISSLKLQNTTVAGWSLGGAVAQRLAIDHPRLVTRLVLISTLPAGKTAISPSPDVMRILSGEGLGYFAKVMELLFPASSPRAKQCFLKDMFLPVDYVPSAISSTATHAQKKIMEEWKHDNQAFRVLRTLSTPVQILTGNEDAVIPAANSVMLKSVLPHATLTEIDRAGHAMMYQYPCQLAQHIEEFIQGFEGQPYENVR